MIVVDSSALISIILDEPEADFCQAALENGGALAISAATLVESLIVADGRGLRENLEQLVGGLKMEIVEVSAVRVMLVADAYRRWGKGFHPASLNFGDCFAYALAAERGWPLLYVGNDFARTDVLPALPA